MDGQRPISFSRVSTYTYHCPFAYYLRYVAKVDTPKTGLTRLWGRALHRAIETWHNANRTPDLERLFASCFILDLEVIDPAFRAPLDTLDSLVAEHQGLVAELSKTYKSPLATKAYLESTTARNIRELRTTLAALADKNAAALTWTRTEDPWQKFLLHRDIAAKYLVFDAQSPLWDNASVELTLKETTDDGIPTIAKIDQVRTTADGEPFIVDLKTNKEPIVNETLATNYQLAHYQYVWNIPHPDAPAGGAARYYLRHGIEAPQRALTPELAAEWHQTMRMVLDAERHNIFPRRRDDHCTQCDYHEVHCLCHTGPIGDRP